VSDLAGDQALLKSLEADRVDKRGPFQNPVWLDGLRRHIREYHGVEGRGEMAKYGLAQLVARKTDRDTEAPICVSRPGPPTLVSRATLQPARCPWTPDGPPHPHSAEGYCVEVTP